MDPKLNTNPSGAELRAETELEPSGTVKEDKGYEHEEAWLLGMNKEQLVCGPTMDNDDEGLFGMDEGSADDGFVAVSKEEEKLGFDDRTNTKPSGAELFTETDSELCSKEVGPVTDSEGKADVIDEGFVDAVVNGEEKLGFDDKTKTKPSGLELFVEYDAENDGVVAACDEEEL